MYTFVYEKSLRLVYGSFNFAICYLFCDFYECINAVIGLAGGNARSFFTHSCCML